MYSASVNFIAAVFVDVSCQYDEVTLLAVVEVFTAAIRITCVDRMFITDENESPIRFRDSYTKARRLAKSFQHIPVHLSVVGRSLSLCLLYTVWLL